jgi:hypothetical protein
MPIMQDASLLAFGSLSKQTQQRELTQVGNSESVLNLGGK